MARHLGSRDNRAMTTAQQRVTPEQEPPERASAAERLETALGGDLTRFLLAALAKPQSTTKL